MRTPVILFVISLVLSTDIDTNASSKGNRRVEVLLQNPQRNTTLLRMRDCGTKQETLSYNNYERCLVYK